MKTKLWKNWLLLVIGLFTALLPFMGFPSLWRAALSVFAGLGVLVLSFSLAQPLCNHNEEKVE